jgi:hypothetical protein
LRQLNLVLQDSYYYADAGKAHRITRVYVSNVQAVWWEGESPRCLVAIPSSVPDAASWVVRTDDRAVYVNPPYGSLQWTKYMIYVVTPAQHHPEIHGGM